MTVTSDHWLSTAVRVPYPAGSAMLVRRFLVFHFTSGASARSSIDFWRTSAAAGAEAHVVIDRDGTVFQLRPFNQTADHAGNPAGVTQNPKSSTPASTAAASASSSRTAATMFH